MKMEYAFVFQLHSVLGGHIAVVTPLPVLKESGTPTTISPCSSTASSAAVASSLLQQPDCQSAAAPAVERPAGTTMITFSCEKRLFPKNQDMAASSSPAASAVAGYVPVVANDESEALFYSSRTNL